jgi:hypothetical protein
MFSAVERALLSILMTKVQFLTTMSRLVVGPTHLPLQWILGVLFPELKQLGHKTDHSPPSTAKVKNAWSYISTHPICLHGMVLNQAMDSSS